jgi:hypothetical protein
LHGVFLESNLAGIEILYTPRYAKEKSPDAFASGPGLREREELKI